MARHPQVTSELLLKLAPWSAIDSAYEKLIPFDSPHESRDLLARMVIEGRAAKHDLIRDGRKVGIVISRVDEGNQGRELVIVAAYSESRESLTHALGEAMHAIAQAEKCCSIRFHTVRPALAHIACEDFGYHVTEIVLRRNIAA